MKEFLPVLVALVIIAWLIAKSNKYQRSNPASTASPSRSLPRARQAPAPAYIWPAIGDFDFEVVGESYYQPAISALAGEHGDDGADLHTTALLVPDNHNPYDDKAVRVDIRGLTVGHLSRDNARSFRRRLAQKKLGTAPTQCDALIMGGFVLQDGQRADYGVRLDIRPFE